jgi:GNAT superfamily N-acetyltransferase
VEKKQKQDDQQNRNPSIKKMQILKWFSFPVHAYDFNEKEENENKNSTSIKHQPDSNIALINEKCPDVMDLKQFGEIKPGYAYIQMQASADLINQRYENDFQQRITKQVSIRVATYQDIPKLVDMYNRAFLTANDPYAPMTEENMELIFNYHNTVILIGSIYGSDAGFVIIDFEGKNKEKGIIAGLGTLPEWQKRGIGTTIGIASWEYFKKKNVKELHCEVYSKNYASYRLIKGMGFHEIGVKFYDIQR